MFDIHATQFPRDGGNRLQIGRMTFFEKMCAKDTQGAYCVMEAIVPQESGSGLHRHWSYDEAAFVLSGRFACHVDGADVALCVGESVYWPRGAIHKFRCVGPEDGRILFICSPGRIFEEFFAEVGTSSVDGGTAVSGPADHFRTIAARHGIEFLA